MPKPSPWYQFGLHHPFLRADPQGRVEKQSAGRVEQGMRHLLFGVGHWLRRLGSGKRAAMARLLRPDHDFKRKLGSI